MPGPGIAAESGEQFRARGRRPAMSCRLRPRPPEKRGEIRAAASSTRANSAGRSAGRSAFRAATARSGRGARTAAAPCASAAFRPPPGLVRRRSRAPSAASSAPGQGVVRDDRHIPHRRRRPAPPPRCPARTPGRGPGAVRRRRCPRACSWPAPGASGVRPRSTARAVLRHPLLRIARHCHLAVIEPGGRVGAGAYGVLDRPAAWGDTCAAPAAGRSRSIEEGVRVPRRRIGFWYRLAAVICKPPLVVLIKRDWRGMENIPADGRIHHRGEPQFAPGPASPTRTSSTTPAVFRDSWRRPALFKKGFVGAVMRGTGQIPVYRETTDAAQRLPGRDRRRGARRVRRLLPRGHPHPRPRRWPMTGKTGAARVALQHQVPGDPGRPVGRQRTAAAVRRRSPTSFPRKTHHVLAGPPVDLVALLRPGDDPELLKEATEVIMAAVTEPAGGDPRREGARRRRTTRAEVRVAHGARRRPRGRQTARTGARHEARKEGQGK